jgi:hypothetical protein
MIRATCARLRQIDINQARLGPSAAPRNPTRGGQNLTNRHIRLARSVRGKEYFAGEAGELKETSQTAAASDADTKKFYGLTIPVKPRPPAADGTCL